MSVSLSRLSQIRGGFARVDLDELEAVRATESGQDALPVENSYNDDDPSDEEEGHPDWWDDDDFIL